VPEGGLACPPLFEAALGTFGSTFLKTNDRGMSMTATKTRRRPAQAAGRYRVTRDDQPNGVGFILGAVLEENFNNFPERAEIARRVKRPIAVDSVDTDQTTTAEFGARGVQLRNGLQGKPAVTVKATVDQITEVSQLKMIGGGLVPVGFFTKRGLKVLGQIARHKLVVKGLIKHPLTSLRFIALVSIVK